jgi:hypothetical protein
VERCNETKDPPHWLDGYEEENSVVAVQHRVASASHELRCQSCPSWMNSAGQLHK